MRARLLEASGPAVAAAGVALFFLLLRLDGWHWPDVGVPGGTGLYFLDLRFFTSAWECVRDGVQVVPVNPCDPRGREFNYPRAWLAPAPLGLAQDDTVRLGKLLVLAFFASSLLAIGRARALDGAVWALALCSPAVMLGVERGNPDLLLFCLVVWGLLLLRARTTGLRVAGHALLFLPAVLKLYPAFAWVPILLQRRRWALWGGGALAVGFAIYLVLIRSDLERIRETVPRDEQFAFGAPILGEEVGGSAVVLTLGLALAALVAAVALRRGPAAPGPAERRDLDLFLAGATVYAATYALGHNYNYRMVFLLLTLPLLLRWSRRGRALLPAAPFAVAAVVATLWLGTTLPVLPFGIGEWWRDLSASFPYDELLNAALFGYLAAGVAVTLVARRAEAAA